MSRKAPAKDDVERAVFGEACGSEGYLTIGEARALARALRAGRTSFVLDVGAGRGWPGRLIAAVTGCRMVLSDVPCSELVDALGRAKRDGIAHRCDAVVATAAALPFRERSFDAIVHADVMC
jgi:ubiquinone/menaquinone biosynthesis C-methylase UbiE